MSSPDAEQWDICDVVITRPFKSGVEPGIHGERWEMRDGIEHDEEKGYGKTGGNSQGEPALPPMTGSD